MNDIMEKILNAPPDDFERALFFAERVMYRLEETLARSKRVSQTLDKSYDLLLSGMVKDPDPEESAIIEKTRTMVGQYRGFRDDANTDKLLTWVFRELHRLHALYRGRTP